MPKVEELSVMPDYTVSRILQIYLEAPEGSTHRIRSRSYPERTVYTETTKTRIDGMSCIEDEREIDEATFDALSKKILGGTRPILKTRHTFSFEGLVVEIDIYPDWSRHAIMEIELPERLDSLKIPSIISIKEDVTGVFGYSNSRMSQCFPKEPD